MEITKIERMRGKRGRYAVYLDGVRTLEIHDSIMIDHKLCTGDTVNDRTVEAIRLAETELTAREIAINFLSYRPRSSKEVIDHLRRKKIPQSVATQSAERLAQLRLLNDLEFARMFVRDKLRQRRSGSTLIRRQLMEKGISPAMVEQVFGEVVSASDVRDACLHLAQKRLEREAAGKKRSARDVRRQRMTEYLLRRGFEYDVVLQTVQTLFSERS